VGKPPPLRVAIVGAGPCGLVTAIALRKFGIDDVTIFDRYPTVRPAVGAAFNLNGGAAILDKLGLGKIFRDLANPMTRVRARRVGGDRITLMDLNVPKMIMDDPVASTTLTSSEHLPENLPRELRDERDVLCGTVMRADLLEALSETLPEETLSGLGKDVTGAETLPGGGARLLFGNGEKSDRFDLVVGCDGIRSKIRESVPGIGRSGAKYGGIRILFGVTGDATPETSSARREGERGEAHQWFGDGCYTLVFTGGGERRKRDNVAVCVADDGGVTKRRDENAGWLKMGSVDDVDDDADAAADDERGRSNRASNAIARVEVIATMERYGMPREAIDVAASCERFFDIGVHYHDPIPSWSDPTGSLVLAGDACHAMPPFLGQGANQAFQDAYVLARNLSAVRSSGGKSLSGAFESVKAAMDAYEATRKPSTTRIMQSSRVIGFVETGSGPVAFVRDVAFAGLGATRLVGKIFLQNASLAIGEED
jgi:2-polyprenyl-6-methoxyphenol hydroxylase-like FAD-dependent oxidoreductase